MRRFMALRGAESPTRRDPDIGTASFAFMPALDGFRALSIALVVVSHADLANVVPGGFGVIVFFVISGFLITRQIVAEIGATGSLNFTAFYLRRVFRLAPALFLYLALFSSLLRIMGADIAWFHVASGVFYIANYYHIFIGYPPRSPNPILWSLSIEEHFYLVAPLAVFLFRRDLGRLLGYLGLLLLLVPLWRLAVFQICSATPAAGLCGVSGGLRIFHGTDTMFDCIAYGCAMAVIMHRYSERVRRVVLSPMTPWLALGLLAGSCLLRDPLFRDTARYSVQSASVAMILVSVLYGRWAPFSRLLCSRPFQVVGRLSYSLYLFHFGVGIVLRSIFPAGSFLTPLNLILYFGSSFVLASLSYFFVERPMVAVRKRFSAVRLARAGAAASGGNGDIILSASPPR
jgi:peptidoglycan/LPS O-acetylase OafA/YrhL